MKKKDTVTLIGFGTFKVAQRKARKGRNPQTGAEIRISFQGGCQKIENYESRAYLEACLKIKRVKRRLAPIQLFGKNEDLDPIFRFYSVWLPEVYLVNPWLMGEKCKPIIIRNADKTVHLLPQGTLSTFCINAPFYRVI